MTYRFIDQHKDQWPVRWLCDALGVWPASYYAWRQRSRSVGHQRRDALLVEIRAIHAQFKARYGSPRIHAELVARVEILVQFGPTWRPKSSSKTGPPSATACKLVHCNNAVPATGGGGWSTWKNTHAFDKPITKST